MLLTEYADWVRYRNTRGTLSTPRRVEQGLARICQLICTASGIKKDADINQPYTVEDFMPHEDGFAERQSEITLDEAIAKGLI